MIDRIIKENGVALVIAVFCVIISWSYLTLGSILHPIVVVVFAVAALVVFLIYFLIIRLLINKYVKSDLLYPNFIFRTLFPFFITWIVSFVVYFSLAIEPFAVSDYFIKLLREFSIITFAKTLFFAVLIGILLTISYKKPVEVPFSNSKKRKNNTLAWLFRVSIFMLIMVLFYFCNFIKQPKVENRYVNYQNINKLIESDNYSMKLFLEDDEYYLKAVSPPYYRANTSEIIIYFTYDRAVPGNNQEQFIKGYVVNKEGEIVRSIDERTIEKSGNSFFPVYFRNGLLVDVWSKSNPEKAITFLFDGDTLIKDFNAVSSNESWQIEKIVHDNTKVKTVSFFKTFELASSQNDIKYNGTMYYNILKDEDTLKIKIDSIYSDQDSDNYYEPKEVRYYECKNMNFSLVCFNQQKYYIIKHKK